MLEGIAVSILVIMLSAFAISAVFGILISLVFLIKKMYSNFLKAIIYLFFLGITTILTSLPFLKMHGSYSDTDRILMIAFCLMNIALIVLYLVTRIRILVNHSKQKSHN